MKKILRYSWKLEFASFLSLFLLTAVIHPLFCRSLAIGLSTIDHTFTNIKSAVKLIKMAKDLWINLPVKNATKSKEFFTKVGFSFNPNYPSNNSACLLVGEKKVVVMLFEEPQFKGFTGKEIAETLQATEVLLSVGADSKEEVDEMAKKAVAAGGASKHQPHEMTGSMYGCVFTDLDGHSWNVLYMDTSKMNQ